MPRSATPRALLVHWNHEEARERAGRLREAGFRAATFSESQGVGIRKIRDDPPDVLVIDLGRLPSHGRQAAVYFRQQPPTRRVPLVFVGGEPSKVAQTRKLIPDAVYTGWARIGPALRRAVARPPEKPVIPGTMEGYSGTPLPKKLGIKAGTAVALVGAPDGTAATLGDLPEGTTLRNGSRGTAGLLLVFSRSKAEFARRLPAAKRAMREGGSIWFFWPKKSSGVATDLDQFHVRRAGLAAGLVDYKICAFDETWSGLRFARRRIPGKHK